MGKLTEFKLIFVVLMLVAFFQNATSGGFWSYASLYFIDFLRTPAVYFSYFLIGTTTIGVVLSILLGRIAKIRKITSAVIFFHISTNTHLFTNDIIPPKCYSRSDSL